MFKAGKPVKLIKTTYEDGCVNYVKANLSSFLELRKLLSSLASQRDKDYARKRQQLKYEQ